MHTHPLLPPSDDRRPLPDFYGRRYLRFNELQEIGLATSRVALRKLIAAGMFPPPIRLGYRTLIWDTAEIAALIERRKAERTAAPTRQSSAGGPA